MKQGTMAVFIALLTTACGAGIQQRSAQPQSAHGASSSAQAHGSPTMLRGAVQVTGIRHPDGLAYGIAYENGSGRDVVRVAFTEGGHIESMVFAPTGQQERDAVQDPGSIGPLSAASNALIRREHYSLAEALDLALGHHPNDAVRQVVLEEESGRLVVKVTLDRNDSTVEVAYDADSGERIAALR